MRLFDILSVLYAPVDPLQNNDHLLRYIQPKLDPDGNCPIVKEPGDEYDLTTLLENPKQKPLLMDLVVRLDRLVRWVNQQNDVSWLGVYLQHGDNLIKYAYQGAMSKAEFEISIENREKSVNARVFMDDKPVVIEDVFKVDGYYRCDASVRAELCCPIHGKDGKPMGIFDCEDKRVGFFSGELEDDFKVTLRQGLETFLQSHPYFE